MIAANDNEVKIRQGPMNGIDDFQESRRRKERLMLDAEKYKYIRLNKHQKSMLANMIHSEFFRIRKDLLDALVSEFFRQDERIQEREEFIKSEEMPSLRGDEIL